MSEAHDYEDLHRLVDRLTPDQAQAVRAVVLQLTERERPDVGGEGGRRPSEAGQHRRRISFAGLMRAEPDLAARSEEILRTEFGRSPA